MTLNNNIKKAFDNIGPTDEQKKRMLDNILASKKAVKIHNFRFVPYLAGAAAVLMIAAGIYTYGNVLDYSGINNPSNNGIDNVVSNVTDLDDINTASAKPDADNTDNDKAEQSNTNLESATVPSSMKMTSESKKVVNDSADTYNINHHSLLPGSVFARGIAASYEVTQQTEQQELTLNEYMEYLGEDFTEKIVVPDGMTLNTEETMIFTKVGDGFDNDEWYFLYTSDDDRIISVITSKNLDKTEEILLDSYSQSSKINAVDVKIFGIDEKYSVFFINNSVSYTVTTDGISEDDVKKIINSITK